MIHARAGQCPDVSQIQSACAGRCTYVVSSRVIFGLPPNQCILEDGHDGEHFFRFPSYSHRPNME